MAVTLLHRVQCFHHDSLPHVNTVSVIEKFLKAENNKDRSISLSHSYDKFVYGVKKNNEMFISTASRRCQNTDRLYTVFTAGNKARRNVNINGRRNLTHLCNLLNLR